MIRSKLYLVGAGPGDPDLITLKAVEVLKHADVVLYDALANEDLLNYCKPDCAKVFVGKRAGRHYQQQQEINQLIVDHGKHHQHIVRLKGGDPFVFGRGQEEKEFAQAHGMTVEVVPGISSALAVPAVHQIPLTMRGVNESFWVITGTIREGGFSGDMELAAQSSATVIILMGMKQLASIVALFKKHRGSKEPVAIIMNGTCENENSGVGTLADIEQVVADKGLDSPSIIVIGGVVNYGAESLNAISSHFTSND
jgi:uroporphyrin-III C-methyltransferase